MRTCISRRMSCGAPIALATEREWDHLTLLTAVEMRGFWEITAISYFGLGFVFGNEPWLAANPRSARYVGVGAFQLVRRAAYEKSGGHSRLRMDVIEDMKLGKLMKMAGVALRRGGRAGHGPRALAQRRAKRDSRRDQKHVCRGALQSVLCRRRDDALAHDERAAVFRPWYSPRDGRAYLPGLRPAPPSLIHGAMIWSTDASPLYGLTHPLGALLFCWMIGRSAIATLWRGGVIWRDTFYPLEELRKGMV